MFMRASCQVFEPRPQLCLGSIGWFLCSQLILLALILVDLVNPLDPKVYGAVCFALLAGITFRTWLQTEQGNHPIFLFMLFLILFQFGRLVSWSIFFEWTIADFDLTVAEPFTVEDEDLKKSMLLVPLSASYVYLGFFYTRRRKVLEFAQNDRMRTFFAWLYFVTIPFVVYKSGSYLKYTLEHGGYIATYLGEGEHLEQVGILMRALALLNTMAFLPYIVVERRVKFLSIAITTYLLVMVLELLVGFRGKFFIHLMFLWMIYNIKRGSAFKPIAGLIGAFVLMAAAIGAEIFRESKSGLDVNLVEYFLRAQGVSFYVTVSSVIYYDIFHPNSWSYLFNQLLLPYQHLSRFGDGALLTLDLTAFLNPNIVSYALGTGETYIANLYLLKGVAAVCVGSFLVGLFTSWISKARTVFWQTIALSILLWIPYLPRSGYLEPIASFTKYFIMAVVGFSLYAVFAWLQLNLRLPQFLRPHHA